MKKLVLFTEEDLITDIINVDNLQIKGNDFLWIDGSLQGVHIQYAVLPDNVQLNKGEIITQDIKEQDESADHIYIDKEAQQMESMQVLVNQMLLDPKNFEQDEQIQQTQQMLNNLMLGGL